MKNNDVVILAAKRSPTGKFQGALKDWSPVQIAVPIISPLFTSIRGGRRIAIGTNLVDRVIMGSVYSAGEGQHVSRQFVTAARLLSYCKAHRIERVCTASLQALWDAYLFAKEYDELIIAGGMDSMSRTPFLLKRADRAGIEHSLTRDDPDPFIDSMLHDGLLDAYLEGNPHMGEIADEFARNNRIEREAQDEYAFQSYYRAYEARKKVGTAGMGIVSAPYPIAYDESVVEPSIERLRQSSPVFGETITSGTSSKRSDGAALLLVTSFKKAKMLDAKPVARIIAFADYATARELYVSAPITAVENVLSAANMKGKDIDLVEYHEPFAVSPIYFIQKCSGKFGGRDVLEEKMNVWGGAIAQGHPLGATGAIRVVTLIHALQHYGKRYGLAVACNGGGEAVACIIENLQR